MTNGKLNMCNVIGTRIHKNYNHPWAPEKSNFNPV